MSGACLFKTPCHDTRAEVSNPGPGGWRANALQGLAPTYTNIPDWKFLVVLKTLIMLMQMCLIRV